MKVHSFGLVHNLPKNSEKKSFDLRCKVMKVEVVLHDVGARENGAKTHVVREYSFAHPMIKLQKRHL
jgi:hypothetical protein